MSIPNARLVASTGDDYNYKNDISRSSSPDSRVSDGSNISTRSNTTTGSNTSTNSDTSTGSNASTNSSISDGNDPSTPRIASQSKGNFRSLLWSSDGTSLVTHSADHRARVFILPPDLLTPTLQEVSDPDYPSAHHLSTYSVHAHPSPIHATALSPFYTLDHPETTLILTSPHSLPIRLFSPFAAGILATYPLIRPETEQWIAPHSLLFSAPDSNLAPGTENSLRFLAGSRNQISLFDVSRDGAGPVTTMTTAPGNRKARRGGSHAMVGIVSCMAMSCEGILAAGTFTRGVGLYDSYGMGESLGTWSLKDGEEGNGVTSVQWSKCGRYLLVAERVSDGVSVWDIRGTGKRLAWLCGRKADTTQRLDIALGDEWRDNDGSENVYAGGTDGYVRVWSNIGKKEAQLESDWLWKAHDDVVSGIKVHTCGSVLATSSGSHPETTYDELSGIEFANDVQREVHHSNSGRGYDNSIRVWSLETSTATFDEAGTPDIATAPSRVSSPGSPVL